MAVQQMLKVPSGFTKEQEDFLYRLVRALTETNGIGWNAVDSTTATTDDIAEGQENQYYSNSKVYQSFSSQIQEGNGLSVTTDDEAETLQIDLTKGAAVADAAITVTGSAGAAYTATEQGMINALKIDVTSCKTQLNALLASLRTAGHLNT